MGPGESQADEVEWRGEWLEAARGVSDAHGRPRRQATMASHQEPTNSNGSNRWNVEARVGNLLMGLGNGEGAERFETLVMGAGARVERIVSWGQASPEGFWYDQGWDEWVLVVQGRAGVRCEGEELRELGPGDWLWLPAGCRHRVEWTESEPPTVWLAVHVDEGASARRGGTA